MTGEGVDETPAITAFRATGPIIWVGPKEFTLLVYRMEAPLVVASKSGILRTRHRYLTTYKGMFFHTSSPEPLRFGATVELVVARRIRIP